MQRYVPLMIALSGRRCLVVGGGKVAERKIAALMEAEATVTAVSPAFTGRIREWMQQGKVNGVEREYRTEDGDGAFLVIAATDRPDVNERVYRDACARNQLVNVTDRPEWCSVTMPAVLRRGKLVVAVSTSGASPLLAAQLRDRIGAFLGDEVERYLDFLDEFRSRAKTAVKDPARRRELLQELLREDGPAMMRDGRWDAFRQTMLEKLDEASSCPD